MPARHGLAPHSRRQRQQTDEAGARQRRPSRRLQSRRRQGRLMIRRQPRRQSKRQQRSWRQRSWRQRQRQQQRWQGSRPPPRRQIAWPQHPRLPQRQRCRSQRRTLQRRTLQAARTTTVSHVAHGVLPLLRRSLHRRRLRSGKHVPQPRHVAQPRHTPPPPTLSPPTLLPLPAPPHPRSTSSPTTTVAAQSASSRKASTTTPSSFATAVKSAAIRTATGSPRFHPATGIATGASCRGQSSPAAPLVRATKAASNAQSVAVGAGLRTSRARCTFPRAALSRKAQWTRRDSPSLTRLMPP